MSTSQSTSISSPQPHTFNVYTIDPRSYHYLVTRYEPALTRPQRAYLLDPNRHSSKSPKRIYHQPGDPIILYPGLTQLDYLGDKIDGVDGLRRMSGDELVERHWYKRHMEPPSPATDQVPVLFRTRMMQRLEEGTVEEAKNDERKRWIQTFLVGCLKLLGCFGRNRGKWRWRPIDGLLGSHWTLWLYFKYMTHTFLLMSHTFSFMTHISSRDSYFSSHDSLLLLVTHLVCNISNSPSPFGHFFSSLLILWLIQGLFPIPY